MRRAESKVAPLAEIVRSVEAARGTGRRIALASGRFDLLHAGEVRFLNATRDLADVLVVAVAGGEAGQESMLLESDRALLVAAVRAVDHVLIVPRTELDEVRAKLQPDVYRAADEAETRALIEQIRAPGGAPYS